MEKKEFNLRGNIVTIDHNFTFKETGIKLSVCNTNDWFIVCRKEDLKPAEESFSYKRKQELQKEIDNLENTKKQKIKETQDEAIKKLESRLRLNSAFSDDTKMATLGLMVATELKKLIKKT